MRVLGIDTSSPKLGLALVSSGKLIARLELTLERGHAQYLIPSLDKLLKKAKLSINKIDALAISIGPGSFTGLRIGVSTIKAISIAKNKKILAVPSLDVLAYNGLNKERGLPAGRQEYICPVIDARKNKIYAALYRKDKGRLKKQTKDLLISPEDLVKIIKKPTLFLGDALKVYKEAIGHGAIADKAIFAEEKLWFPRAEFVALLGEQLAKKKKFTNPLDLVPLYLHKRDCQIRK